MTEKEQWITAQMQIDLHEVERLVAAYDSRFGHFDSHGILMSEPGIRHFLCYVAYRNLRQWREENGEPSGELSKPSLDALIAEISKQPPA